MMERKAKTVTFRLYEDIIDKLEREAKNREISLNKFASQIFKNFLDWDMLQAKAGMIPIAKLVIVEIFEKMTKEEVEDLAKRVGKDTVQNIILFMEKDLTLASILSWIEAWIKKNSTAGFTSTKKNGIQTYIMKHDLGENWSLYHKTILVQIFKEVLNEPITIDTRGSTLRFSFKNHGS